MFGRERMFEWEIMFMFGRECLSPSSTIGVFEFITGNYLKDGKVTPLTSKPPGSSLSIHICFTGRSYKKLKKEENMALSFYPRTARCMIQKLNFIRFLVDVVLVQLIK